MPQITRVSPSTKGSKPVSEVLKGIQVQDSRQVSTSSHGRRMSDYESRSPALQAVAILVIAVILAGGLWSVSLRKLAGTWNARPISLATQETLIIPAGLHPLP
jgi:hypothetical protein